MTIAMKFAIFGMIWLAVGLFSYVPAQTKLVRVLRSLLIILVALSPMLLDQRPRAVVLSCLTLFFMGIERLFYIERYDFVSDEHFKTAVYTIISRIVFFAVGFYWLDAMAGHQVSWGLEANRTPVWIQVITVFVVIDFARWVMHLMAHKFDWWWQFHKMHHCPTEVSALTAGRFHFAESVFMALVVPTFIAYLLGIRAEVFVFAWQVPSVVLANAYSHVNIDFPKSKAWWAYLISSPNAHRHHHTREGGQSNYGFTLLIWDWIFGTLEIPQEVPTRFGIDEVEIAQMGVLEQVLHPFGVKLPATLGGLETETT